MTAMPFFESSSRADALARAASPELATPTPSFEELYDEHAELVWRVLRRLGVPLASVDDAAQDVFLVAHRRLGDFAGRSSVKTWLFGILSNVAQNHLRTARRKSPEHKLGGEAVDPDTLADERRDPEASAENAEAVRTLYALLDELDPDKRAVFVLAELEGMTMPEIALALEVNLNTAYARLRAARQAFERGVQRLGARTQGRSL